MTGEQAEKYLHQVFRESIFVLCQERAGERVHASSGLWPGVRVGEVWMAIPAQAVHGIIALVVLTPAALRPAEEKGSPRQEES